MGSEPVIFVIDDDPKLLRLVEQILREEGFAAQTYSNGADFLGRYTPDRRGCLLLDIQLPGLNGVELYRELLARGIDVPVVFLTATADVATAVSVMKAGALDLLQKPFTAEALLAAVRHAIARDDRNAEERRHRREVHDRLVLLTPRERQVMDLVVRGFANKSIAQELELSERTVEIHRSRVMEKMQARSVAELVRLSMIIDSEMSSPRPTV